MKYETEEQQIDAIKSWWKKNGNSLVYGLSAVIIGLSGWNYWQSSTKVHSESASHLYEQVRAGFQGDAEAAGVAARQARDLMNEYDDTPYADQAKLLLATHRFEAGELNEAVNLLVEVRDSSNIKANKMIAMIRLTKIFETQKEYAQAQAQIDQALATNPSESATAELKMIQVRMLMAQEKRDEARDVLATFTVADDSPLKPLNQLMRDELSL